MSQLSSLLRKWRRAKSQATPLAPRPFLLEYDGFCPICSRNSTFRATGNWLRGTLLCQSCPNGSVPRERALALVLEESFPEWRSMAIHECSPIERGISIKLHREAKNLVRTQFYPGVPLGEVYKGFRNEDLQKQTFSDNQFDLFISLDVFEHIPEPVPALREVFRTLKPGGSMLCTWPVRKAQVAAMEYRAKLKPDGSFEHLKEPEYHGNPVDPKGGSLVTVDYGYDVHKLVADANFDTRVYRFADKRHGILGEYTEVFLCKKSPPL